MKLTPRNSLLYVIGYLIPTGLGLLLAPAQTLKLAFSNASYDDVMPRAVGLMLFGLGLLVLQLYRLDIKGLYPTTVAVRAVFLTGFFALFVYSRDPLFLFICGVVGFGMSLTAFAYWSKRS